MVLNSWFQPTYGWRNWLNSQVFSMEWLTGDNFNSNRLGLDHSSRTLGVWKVWHLYTVVMDVTTLRTVCNRILSLVWTLHLLTKNSSQEKENRWIGRRGFAKEGKLISWSLKMPTKQWKVQTYFTLTFGYQCGEEDKFAERVALWTLQVNMDLIKKADNEDLIFLHCLPAYDTNTVYGKDVAENSA